MKNFFSHYQHFVFYRYLIMTLAAMLSFLGNCSKDTTKPPSPPPPNIPDTTSHNFTWQTYSFGYGNASILQDVAIIDKNNIWAVGEIYPNDSTTQPFGAVHWDGQQWKLIKLPTQAPPTGYIVYLRPNGIFAFSPSNIWVASGGVHRFNGTAITESFWINDFPGNPNPILGENQYVTKLWGTSDFEIYAVGPNGAIAFYNGAVWQRIESGTITNINDVWGVKDETTNNSTVLVVVSNRSHEGEYRLLSLNPSFVHDTLNWTLQRRLFGVWFLKDSPVYVCGSGLRVWTEDKWTEIPLPNYFSTRIRGSAPNNIFVVGAFGLFAHYNGSTWHVYDELFLPNGSLEGLAVSENIVVAVGYVDNHDVLIMGWRK